MLGEMKCGTTSLYSFLLNHPQVIAPATKEPRFLQQNIFKHTTLSRYSMAFDSISSQENDSVTFDASPTHFRSDVALSWISQWLPEAKLIVLLRDPIQRSFSHWKMGSDWLHSSAEKDIALSTALERFAPYLTFKSLVWRGLAHIYWKRCSRLLGTKQDPPTGLSPLQFNLQELYPAWNPPVGALYHKLSPPAFNSSFVGCLLRQDEELFLDFVDEIEGRSPEILSDSTLQWKAILKASEFMLDSKGFLLKSAVYATQLEKWFQVFPRSQVHIIHTDDLSTDPIRVVNGTFDFLGLPRVRVNSSHRICVKGLQGVMPQMDAKKMGKRIGPSNDGGAAFGSCYDENNGSIPIGMIRDKAGVLQHYVDPVVARRLRHYFSSPVKRLYRLLGRDLGWGI